MKDIRIMKSKEVYSMKKECTLVRIYEVREPVRERIAGALHSIGLINEGAF